MLHHQYIVERTLREEIQLWKDRGSSIENLPNSLVRKLDPIVQAAVKTHRKILPKEDPDDLIGAIRSKIYFKLQNYNNQAAISTWVYRVVRNEFIDSYRNSRIRKRKKSKSRFISLEELEQYEDGKSSPWIAVENENPYEKTASSLDPPKRKVDYYIGLMQAANIRKEKMLFNHLRIFGHKTRSIANAIGEQHTRVKTEVYRRRKKLEPVIAKVKGNPDKEAKYLLSGSKELTQRLAHAVQQNSANCEAADRIKIYQRADLTEREILFWEHVIAFAVPTQKEYDVDKATAKLLQVPNKEVLVIREQTTPKLQRRVQEYIRK